MRFAVVAHRTSETNARLGAGAPGGVQTLLLSPRQALRSLRRGDVALARLDVKSDLDGIEDGIWALELLAAEGVRVLNRPSALLCAHDKLLTARVLEGARLPHPRTVLARSPADAARLRFPLVVKPRFGSWGRDVTRCEGPDQLEQAFRSFAFRPWLKLGALVQELVPPQGYDVRVVVAGGEVVGSVQRHAAPGEWRTNVALGGSRVQAPPARLACELALAAATALDADLVGVDLLPLPDGGFVVLEVNGAVDFGLDYSPGGDVFARAMAALCAAAGEAGPPALAAAATA